MSAFAPPNPFDLQKPIDGIKNVIVVGAGKGGVGKSTVSVNLALALLKKGLKVGILDADVYGPSIPRMLGLAGLQPNINNDRKIEPLKGHGLKAMSMGFLVDDKSAIIWRGPMLFKAIEQFLRDVAWGELDVLVVDLPPGTGDVQLSIAQKVPVNGAVIVSTPQDMALIDVKRCVDMFDKVKVPIIGLVENMAAFECPHCHHESDLFPRGELHNFCDQHKIEILAKVPFNPEVAKGGESGKPVMLNPGAAQKETAAYIAAADRIASRLT